MPAPITPTPIDAGSSPGTPASSISDQLEQALSGKPAPSIGDLIDAHMRLQPPPAAAPPQQPQTPPASTPSAADLLAMPHSTQITPEMAGQMAEDLRQIALRRAQPQPPTPSVGDQINAVVAQQQPKSFFGSILNRALDGLSSLPSSGDYAAARAGDNVGGLDPTMATDNPVPATQQEEIYQNTGVPGGIRELFGRPDYQPTGPIDRYLGAGAQAFAAGGPFSVIAPIGTTMMGVRSQLGGDVGSTVGSITASATGGNLQKGAAIGDKVGSLLFGFGSGLTMAKNIRARITGSLDRGVTPQPPPSPNPQAPHVQAESVAQGVANTVADQTNSAAGQEVMAGYWQQQDGATQQAVAQHPLPAVVNAPPNPRVAVPVMSLDATQRALAAAADILKSRGIAANSMTPQTVQETVAGILRSNGSAPAEISDILQAHNLSFDDFLDGFLASGSHAGKTLNLRSQWWDMVRGAAMQGNPDAQKILRSVNPQAPLKSWYQNAVNNYKMLLTANLAVATRNIGDALLKRGMEDTALAVNVAINKAVRAMGIDIPEATQAMPTYEDVATMVNPHRAAEAYQTANALAKAYPEIEYRLLNGVNSDVQKAQIGGNWTQAPVSNTIATATLVHRLQENAVRSSVFTTALDRRLRATGTNLTDVMQSGTPPPGFTGMIRDSIADGLDAAWAKEIPMAGGPWSASVGRALKGLSEIPVVGPLLAPFPRYVYNQALLVHQYGPTGALALFGKAERERMAAGDFSQIGRSFVGAGMAYAAWNIVNGRVPGLTPGEKWGEFKTANGNVVSVSAFGTLAPFLGIADYAKRVGEGNVPSLPFQGEDLVESLIGRAPQAQPILNVVNAALAQMGQLGNYSLKNTKETLEEYAGDTAAEFVNPIQQFKTFYATLDKAYGRVAAIHRDAEGTGFPGQIDKMVQPTPFVSGSQSSVPARFSTLRAGPVQTPQMDLEGQQVPGDLIHQLTGVRVESPPRNYVESETARLGFPESMFSPHTGDKTLDQIVSKMIGPVTEKLGPALQNNPVYRDAPDAMKGFMLNVLYHGNPDAHTMDPVKKGGFLPMFEAAANPMSPFHEEALKALGLPDTVGNAAPDAWAVRLLNQYIPPTLARVLDEATHGKLHDLVQQMRERGRSEYQDLQDYGR